MVRPICLTAIGLFAVQESQKNTYDQSLEAPMADDCLDQPCPQMIDESGFICPCGKHYCFCPLCGTADIAVPICAPGTCAVLCAACHATGYRPWMQVSDSEATESAQAYESDTDIVPEISYGADSDDSEAFAPCW